MKILSGHFLLTILTVVQLFNGLYFEPPLSKNSVNYSESSNQINNAPNKLEQNNPSIKRYVSNNSEMPLTVRKNSNIAIQ